MNTLLQVSTFRLNSSNSNVSFRVADTTCDSSGDNNEVTSFRANMFDLLASEALEKAAAASTNSSRGESKVANLRAKIEAAERRREVKVPIVQRTAGGVMDRCSKRIPLDNWQRDLGEDRSQDRLRFIINASITYIFAFMVVLRTMVSQ